MERFSDKNKLPKSNLTDTDENALNYPWKRNDLGITKEDKGAATVILDVKYYILQILLNSFKITLFSKN